MSLHCPCADWEPQIKKLNGPIVTQSIRSGGRYQYDGKPFAFCPWCSRPLKNKCDTCGALLEPGEQTEGHAFFGGCQRQDDHIKISPHVTHGCQKCGTPTFGPLCAKCKGESGSALYKE